MQAGSLNTLKQMTFAEDVEARFDTLNMKQKHYIAYRKKNEKVIGLMKDEFGGKVMTKFIGLKAKSYSHLIDDSSQDKKARITKKCAIKRKFKFEKYKNCLEATQLHNKTIYSDKNENRRKIPKNSQKTNQY